MGRCIASRSSVCRGAACGSGGAALPLQVIADFEKAFNAIIMEGYGLSETSPVASFNMPDAPTKPGTIGRAICEDLTALGLSYDLFTRTTTVNHHTVVREMFTAV